MISRSSLNTGYVGLKTRSLGKICLNLVHPPEATVLLQSLYIFTRMFFLVISQATLNMGYVGSKTRSLGQIYFKPCSPSRGHSFALIFIELY